MILRAAIAAASLFCPGTSLALTLEFPATAIAVAERIIPQDSHFVALAPFQDDQIDGVMAEGALFQQSWKVGSGSLTTLQILVPLRMQLERAGYTTLFECEARACGGFDFRYQIDVLPEPDMHVNLGDFRYLSARHERGENSDFISLVISRSANAGFVQLTQIGALARDATVTASTKARDPQIPPLASGPIGHQLESFGHATLDDLTFRTGSSELSAERFASLDGLATYLTERPDALIVLVGHTDAVGSLSNNIALSRKRAMSVATRLVDSYGVARRQVSADGVGFLAPRASNLTDSGRAQNRRVEVILTSTK